MSTKELLNKALNESIKNSDPLRRDTMRMALSAIKQIEVDKRVVLDEPGIQSVLQKEVKSRRESIIDAEKAERPETIASLEREIAFLEEFLPKQMSKDELLIIVKQAIVEVDAKTPADIGKVMKTVLPRVEGRATGDIISSTVREILSK